MWISPIIDRTKSDAEYAQQHRDAVVENKGAFNATDLNRIEGNIAYLAEQLRSYGYIVILESIKTDWNEQSTWPKSSEFDRIRRPIISCRGAPKWTGLQNLTGTMPIAWSGTCSI